MRNLETVRSSRASFAGGLSAVASAVAGFFERRRLVRQLAELDDHLLRDIGVTRQDVESALSSAYAHDPSIALAQRAYQSRMGRRASAIEQRRWSHLAADAEFAPAAGQDRMLPPRAA